MYPSILIPSLAQVSTQVPTTCSQAPLTLTSCSSPGGLWLLVVGGSGICCPAWAPTLLGWPLGIILGPMLLCCPLGSTLYIDMPMALPQLCLHQQARAFVRCPDPASSFPAVCTPAALAQPASHPAFHLLQSSDRGSSRGQCSPSEWGRFHLYYVHP